MPEKSEEVEYRFLTTPGARVAIRVVLTENGRPELQIHGNRAGLLSLANVLLWQLANSYWREFLPLSALPFVTPEGDVSLSLRLDESDEATHRHGEVRSLDGKREFEWELGEEQLRSFGLMIHHTVGNPAHEYDRLDLSSESDVDVEIRMTDVSEWIGGPSA